MEAASRGGGRNSTSPTRFSHLNVFTLQPASHSLFESKNSSLPEEPFSWFVFYSPILKKDFCQFLKRTDFYPNRKILSFGWEYEREFG